MVWRATCSGVEAEAAELIVFAKYVQHPEHDGDEPNTPDDDMPLLDAKEGRAGSTALLCRRQMSRWQRLVYFLRLSAPEEGDMWIRLPVKPLTKQYAIDKGEFRTRPVNVVDCHAPTAVFVLPFIQLYQVRMVGKNKTLNASRRVRELQTA
jgi:hypothetical protein